MSRVALFLILLLPAMAWAAEQPALLPSDFGGWHKSGASRTSTDTAAADPAYAAVLKEYGFHDLEAATYTRPDRKLVIKAARFNDASGAYGAFTFYKQPQMQTEKIGDQGASTDDKVLFYRGNLLVQATLDRVTAMSAAELRELAQVLPTPTGTNTKLPTLPTYLPRQAYVPHSAKYVVGPAGLGSIDAPVPAALVDFNRGAEVVLGQYSTSAGAATLMLISYPTPQIAGERQRAIEAAMRLPNGSAVSSGHTGEFMVKRTGPMVVLVAGAISSSEAKSLLASVNYDADVTWNERTYFSKKENIGNLIIAIFVLIGILLANALLLGLAVGGVRLLLRRLFPGSIFDRSDEAEIIKLNLKP